MLASKSHRALLIVSEPIEQGIVNLPGSMSLGGRFLWIMDMMNGLIWITVLKIVKNG